MASLHRPEDPKWTLEQCREKLTGESRICSPVQESIREPRYDLRPSIEDRQLV